MTQSDSPDGDPPAPLAQPEELTAPRPPAAPLAPGNPSADPPDPPDPVGPGGPGEPAVTKSKPSLASRSRTIRGRFFRRLKRSAFVDPAGDHEGEPPPPEPADEEKDSEFRLNRMSPFSIGFFGALGAMVALTLVAILGQIQSILVLVIFSLFLALGLNPLVEALTRRGLRRGLGVALVALGVLAVIALAAWAIVPVFSEQVTNLVDTAPSLLNQLRENEQVAEIDERFQIIEKANDFLTSEGLINTVFGGLLGAGRLLANVLFSTVVTLVLTLYFLASLPAIKEAIYRMAPASRRPRVKHLADEMFQRIGGYLSGMFVVVTVAGTAAFIFMMSVGLGGYALALAVMVALFAFIPLIGSNLSMGLIAIVAFSTSAPWVGIAVIIYFLVYQQFEAYFIQPRVMKRSVDVPGAIVIVVALAGGTLLGIVGALLAIPTAAALLLLYREVLIPKLDRS